MSDEPLRDPEQVRRTSMAAERTWLAWWRTALGASVGALGVGRLAPEVLDVAPWPYVLLGAAYGALAIGLLVVGILAMVAGLMITRRAAPPEEHVPAHAAEAESSAVPQG